MEGERAGERDGERKTKKDERDVLVERSSVVLVGEGCVIVRGYIHVIQYHNIYSHTYYP